ncbi:Crp/Fnr family transcriptional regulator [Rubellimicrobium rubrum]|uniref:Crp/Fnr family transcriptional regulator n=2 Tax=Rubellimicrobium rubrum TaxID=2585369 RepID=A0A5C4MXR3_9RHOB|nr:Crp/Fnr family transcriptional regulator [Rubellimicrobium rubrum]
MPDHDLALIGPALVPVDLPEGYVMERPHQAIRHIYFPDTGLASVVPSTHTGLRIEVGVFGRDGMSGTMVLLGDYQSPHETLMQIEGRGHRISVDDLRRAASEHPGLRDHLLRYVRYFAIQVAHTSLANGRVKLAARLARWLLMCHDRLNADEIHLTHEFLSNLLGVRRAGVTVATHVLEEKKLIRARRGLIRILDRDGLVQASQGTYGVPEAEYRRLLGQLSGPSVPEATQTH